MSNILPENPFKKLIHSNEGEPLVEVPLTPDIGLDAKSNPDLGTEAKFDSTVETTTEAGQQEVGTESAEQVETGVAGMPFVTAETEQIKTTLQDHVVENVDYSKNPTAAFNVLESMINPDQPSV